MQNSYAVSQLCAKFGTCKEISAGKSWKAAMHASQLTCICRCNLNELQLLDRNGCWATTYRSTFSSCTEPILVALYPNEFSLPENEGYTFPLHYCVEVLSGEVNRTVTVEVETVSDGFARREYDFITISWFSCTLDISELYMYVKVKLSRT